METPDKRNTYAIGILPKHSTCATQIEAGVSSSPIVSLFG